MSVVKFIGGPKDGVEYFENGEEYLYVEEYPRKPPISDIKSSAEAMNPVTYRRGIYLRTPAGNFEWDGWEGEKK